MEQNKLHIELGMPANKSQREFIDSLNAVLRARMSSSQGSAAFDREGNFVSQLTGSCTLSSGVVNLSWKLHKSGDGTLHSIEIYSEEETDNIPWEQEIYQLITTVFTSVLNDRRSKYFKRSFLFYVGPQLDGEYWLPGFRFAPAWPEDPQPYLINAERVVVFDQNVPALDDMHAQSIATEVVQRNSARLSLLLNTGLYTSHAIECWVMDQDKADDFLKSERRQRGYIDTSTKITEMPQKKDLCELGSYSGDIRTNYLVAGKLLSLPRESRKILRGIDHASPEVAQAFDSGARLYHVGKICGKDFPSVGLAYRVAAVEAICQADKQYKSFSDFVRAHVEDRPSLDEILNVLYREVRSGHFHGGTFPAGEFSRKGFLDLFMGEEQIKRMNLYHICDEITREAIVNWIFQRVPEL